MYKRYLYELIERVSRGKMGGRKTSKRIAMGWNVDTETGEHIEILCVDRHYTIHQTYDSGIHIILDLMSVYEWPMEGRQLLDDKRIIYMTPDAVERTVCSVIGSLETIIWHEQGKKVLPFLQEV